MRRLTPLAALLLAFAILGHADEPKDKDRFAGFPPIGKHRPGERSLKVIASDGAKDLLRPKWTRAMGDLGGWPAMYRFQKNIYLVYPHVDGHREKRLEASGKLVYMVSKDEGKSWKELPVHVRRGQFGQWNHHGVYLSPKNVSVPSDISRRPTSANGSK